MKEMSRKTGNVPEETRAALIKAATEEFAEYGFEKSSLRRICSRAEVTTGALYSSFANKNDLFESVVAPVMEQIFYVIETHFKGERASTGRELLDAQGEKNDIQAVMEILHYYFRHQDVCSILFHHREHPAVSRFFDDLIELLDEQGKHLAKLLGAGEQENPEEAFSEDMIHWFSHLQMDMIFYLIEHEMEEKQAEIQVRNMVRFLRGGLYALVQDGNPLKIYHQK